MISSVRIRKKNGKPLIMEVKEFLIPLKEKHLMVLSEATVVEIRSQIASSMVRPGSTGNLASAFFASKTLIGYGVGDIDYLNTNAKQWYWHNYGIAQSGRRVPPRTTGIFSPGEPHPDPSSFRAGRFSHEVTTNMGLLQPVKAIDAKNYIEKTLAKIFAQSPSILQWIK